jgi:hypothetical protein
VPHLRRSHGRPGQAGSFSIDAPALPGWAMFGCTALRAFTRLRFLIVQNSPGLRYVSAPRPPGLGFELLGGEGTAYLKLPHPVHQGSPLHSQTPSCTIPAAHYPIAGFKGTDDVISLDFLQTRDGQI